MLEPIISGIGLGLLLIVMIGPVFFSLIQTSIGSGFPAGVAMAVGIALSDSIFIILAYWGISKSLSDYQAFLGPVGGVIFILMGVFSVWKNQAKIIYDNPEKISTSGYLRFLIKGFVINSSNPFVILFWIATAGSASVRFGSATQIALFFTVAIVTVISGDILKSALAFRLKRLLTAKLLKTMNYLVAAILVSAGIRLLFVDVVI